MNLVSCFGCFKEVVLHLLFPPRCINCGKAGDFFCGSCRRELVYLSAPICTKCSKPIRSGTVCRKCELQEWDIDGIRSVFKYGGAIRQAIIQFKYDNVKALAEPLAALMSEYVKKQPLPVDIIIPVPAHNKRLRSRGYNQASLLAKRLSQLIAVPVAEGALVRVKNTAPQARTASLNQRRANMAEAFACNRKNVAGKRILLIDDVCTSGTTLNSCAKPLKAAGAASVWGLTLAKET